MARSTDWKAKAKGIAASLKAEYEAGKRGDEAPAQPIWATPKQQLDGLLAVFRSAAGGVGNDADAPSGGADTDVTSNGTGDAGAAGAAPASDEAAEATAVADAMRSVDWASVRAATVDRTADATKAMKSMAEHVDWAKVQPVAAQVSSALIAAIATGQLGMGGRLATTVAKAVTDQGGLGQRVAAQLEANRSGVPTDLRPTIEAASREI